MIQLITKDTSLLVSLSEVKSHMRIDGTYDDTYIQSLIVMAQQRVQTYTSRPINENTYKYIESTNGYDYDYAYNKDNYDRKSLKVPNITTLTSIKTFDTSGVETSLSTDDYAIENYKQYSDIIRKDGSEFPLGSRTYAPLEIVFKAGYTSSTIPEELKLAIMQIISGWYENREGVSSGGITVIPNNCIDILYQWRVVGI